MELPSSLVDDNNQPQTNQTLSKDTDSVKWMVSGSNFLGQLGLGHQEGPITSWTPFFPPQPFREISSSADFCLALAFDGSVWSWGSNEHGVLGHGTAVPLYDVITNPRKISFFDEKQDLVLSVKAGLEHAAVVTKSGQIFTWGSNAFGQLGTGNLVNSSVPCLVPLDTAVIKIECGEHHTVVLSNGRIWNWGSNSNGNLGIGNTPSLLKHVRPVQVSSLEKMTNIWTLWDSTIASCEDESLWGWGRNSMGELGLSHTDSVPFPAKMSLKGFKQIKVGYYHVVALCSDGSLWTWGWNAFGQLGTGSDSKQQYISSPVEVNFVHGSVQSIAAFGCNTFVITKQGNAYGCGANVDGQLGIGNTSPQENSFIPLASLTTSNFFIAAC